MIQDLVAPAKSKMDSALQHFVDELKTLRTGRANAQMLDGVMVPYYGTMTSLKQLATISVPDSQQLVIQPFDVGAINDIRQGIEQADLGFRASDDGRVMRISVPALTTERREEMVKKAGKIAESGRISVRNIRGEIWESIQSSQKCGEISEDNRDWGRAEIDKISSEYNKKIEDLLKEKEIEIRTV